MILVPSRQLQHVTDLLIKTPLDTVGLSPTAPSRHFYPKAVSVVSDIDVCAIAIINHGNYVNILNCENRHRAGAGNVQKPALLYPAQQGSLAGSVSKWNLLLNGSLPLW